MPLTVKEFLDQVDKVTPTYSPLILGDLEYVENTGGSSSTDGLVNKDTGEVYGFTEESFEGFARYLQIPTKFANRLPMPLRTQVINHFMSTNSSRPSIVTHFGSEFSNIFEQRTLLLPPNAVMERVARVFSDDDVIGHVDFRDGLVLSVHTSDLQEAVRVGDSTNGGIRFNAVHGTTPKVSAYMERLVCRNGMVAMTDVDSIPLRGYTLAEVLNSMQTIADHYMKSVLPNYLSNWKTMASIESSNPEQLIHRLSKEAGISPKLETRIIEAAASLVDNSYYEVVNLITSFQHADGVDEKQANKLRELGGAAVRDLGGHRCTSCQHSLG
jgi:hypothetical protein